MTTNGTADQDRDAAIKFCSKLLEQALEELLDKKLAKAACHVNLAIAWLDMDRLAGNAHQRIGCGP